MRLRTILIGGMTGLWMGLPLAAAAQTAEDDAEAATLFVPLVGECVAMRTVETCADVRAVVTECAAELDDALCDVLFSRSVEVFDNPQLSEQARFLLARTSNAIAQMEFPDAHDGEIGEAIEATRANAERTMLRGDENLNSHSSPPLIVEN